MLSERVHKGRCQGLRTECQNTPDYAARCEHSKLGFRQACLVMVDVVTLRSSEEPFGNQFVEDRDYSEKCNIVIAKHTAVNGASARWLMQIPNSTHDTRFEVAKDFGEAFCR